MSLDQVTAFTRPATIAEAHQQVLAGAVPVSGGTDVMLRRHLLAAPVVDLTALPLAGISVEGGTVVVGATTTLTDMLDHEAVRAIGGGVLSGMLRHVGSPLLRNVATIGGHVARGRLSDIIPVLLALDASIAFFDGDDHIETLEQFYGEARHRQPIIVTGISIPVLSPGSAAAFRKFSRTGFDLAILNAACRIDLAGGEVEDARIVIGETPALGARVTPAERVLAGGPLDETAIDQASATAADAVPAGDDDRASATYRRALAAVLVRRCLHDVWRDLQ